jgi:hypothetical protein
MNENMKNYILLILLSFISFGSFSQEECGTQTTKREFNAMARRSGRLSNRSSEPITHKEIPIVFHVLYDDQLLNVSDSTLLVALNDLNIKFNKAKFRFVLVSINRKPLKDFSWYQEYMTEPLTSNKLPSMYGPGASKIFEIGNTMSVNPNTTLNIFVQPKIYGALGFSFIPPFGATTISPAPKPPDGVWIRTSTFSLNPSSYNRNSTLIHEVGHYLGLFHTFNGAFSCENYGLDCGTTGDLVCDTPPFQKSNFRPDCTPGCNVIILESDPWFGYVQDNHMDYLADNCRRSFTNGQINRMHSYVNQNRKDVFKTLSLNCLMDLDNDGLVTSQDFLIYLSCHGTTTESGQCYKCDLDADGLVGSPDFLLFLTGIGQTCVK